MNVWAWMAEEGKKRGIPQKELARMGGVAPASFSRGKIRSHRMRWKVFSRLAKELGYWPLELYLDLTRRGIEGIQTPEAFEKQEVFEYVDACKEAKLTRQSG